jgi:excisionase family DNA binding protein
VVQIAPFFDRDGEEPMSEHQLLAEPLLNAEETARFLKVPRSTLYELVRSRGLPHVRVGRVLRFTRQDLSAWITANSYGLQAAQSGLRTEIDPSIRWMR